MLYKSDSEHAVQVMREDPNMFQEVLYFIDVRSDILMKTTSIIQDFAIRFKDGRRTL